MTKQEKVAASTHSKQEVQLMAEYMGYGGAPCWIFMAALNEWRLSSRAVLANAMDWQRNGKPMRHLKQEEKTNV